ncbi:uncharacterized protein [Struthio camelus]|uniref:uncharacterized protein isoform X2 n=1 Tax=Struthio camelus TaxID=8801 RepID=UPI003603BE32
MKPKPGVGDSRVSRIAVVLKAAAAGIRRSSRSCSRSRYRCRCRCRQRRRPGRAMGPGLLPLLLLLPLPWAAGACYCHHRWPLRPPQNVRLPELGARVSRVELCPHHVLRFLLPKRQRWICGLQDSPWVVELLQIWESREAQRPPDPPPSSPTAPAAPPGSPTAGRSPTAGPPGNPTAGQSPTDTPNLTTGPPAKPRNEGLSWEAQWLALPPALEGWHSRQAMGQDPQVPPPLPLPTMGPDRPPAVGLAVGLALLGAGLGLASVLVCRGRRRGAGPPPACPTRVGPQYDPCEVL